MLKVVVIGSGNVAQHLIKVFKESDQVELVQAYARHIEQLEHILPENIITDSFDAIALADLYIVSVSDDAIAEVTSLLPFNGRLVVHTSGSAALEEIDKKNRRGVFYPLQTFSKNKEVDFSAVPLCLECEHADDMKIIEPIAASLSGNVFRINSEQRKSLHVAAVFVSNFVNHLYTIGQNICDDNNIPFDILKPLILETAAKVQLLKPEEAQTGPAKRNDKKTIKKHMDFLKDENHKTIYALLTKSIQQTDA